MKGTCWLLTREQTLTNTVTVKIILAPNVTFPNVWLSQGTTSAYDPILNVQVFSPKLPWKKLDTALAKNIVSIDFDCFNPYTSIGICEIPNNLLVEMQKILLPYKDKVPALVEANIAALEEKVFETFKHCTYFDATKDFRLAFYEAGLRTASRNEFYKDYPFTGLHIDCLDRLHDRTAIQPRNRFCINIGTESRYFMFIDVPLKNILQMVNVEEITASSTLNKLTSNIGKAFMNSFPNYPVVKIELKPGQAYIAPAEAIIHDASTMDKSVNDFFLMSGLSDFMLPL